MAKKRMNIVKRIDNLPGGFSQQPRSSTPKRRTDFSLFFCNSSGSLLESLFRKLALPENGLNCLHDRNSEGNSLVGCSKTTDEGSGFSSDSVEASVVEVAFVNQNALLAFQNDREGGKHVSNVLGLLEHTPKESHVTENKALCASPASVVCTKTRKKWWPVEDLCRISSRELVKSTTDSNHSDEQDISSDKSTLSVSSITNDDFLERGRGKRERKPKIHFDDITFPLGPERKIRRLRIMRYLGLTPPAGSPF